MINLKRCSMTNIKLKFSISQTLNEASNTLTVSPAEG